MAVITNARTIRWRYDGRNSLTMVERSAFHYSALPRLLPGTKFTSHPSFSTPELPEDNLPPPSFSIPLMGHDTYVRRLRRVGFARGLIIADGTL